MLRNWKMSRLLSVAVMMLVQSITTGVCASSKKGDVNNDGAVTMSDANMVVNHFLSGNTGAVDDVYDVNGDGAVSMSDANMIVNIFLNQIVYVPVDLGLSVKWATCNVGASDPWEYGDYFAWGETESKGDNEYDLLHYKWCDDNYKMTKYCCSSFYGYDDGKTYLELQDDAAYVNMGEGWRMPSRAEQEDLRTKCTWTWYNEGNLKYGGTAGDEVIGTNGNSIFLPAAGYRSFDYYSDKRLYDVGVSGNYWSSDLYSTFSDAAWYLQYVHEYSFIYRNSTTRCDGLSVRGVFTK